jgi:hypothetical protein
MLCHAFVQDGEIKERLPHVFSVSLLPLFTEALRVSAVLVWCSNGHCRIVATSATSAMIAITTTAAIL